LKGARSRKEGGGKLRWGQKIGGWSLGKDGKKGTKKKRKKP